MLIDNTQWLVGAPDAAPGGWSICRRGLNYAVTSQGQFTIRLATTDSIGSGWVVEEANSIRARFSSNDQKAWLTIVPDGRTYWDGKFRPISAQAKGDPALDHQHAAPASVEIPAPMGRLNRNSTGDVNNDGYNEFRGSYALIATGSRLDFTITPQSPPLVDPLFEITGLPDGKPLVTLEGRLIEGALRLDDGTWLVPIPGRLDRPAIVNVRIQ
jgi:hypothetical protein